MRQEVRQNAKVHHPPACTKTSTMKCSTENIQKMRRLPYTHCLTNRILFHSAQPTRIRGGGEQESYSEGIHTYNLMTGIWRSVITMSYLGTIRRIFTPQFWVDLWPNNSVGLGGLFSCTTYVDFVPTAYSVFDHRRGFVGMLLISSFTANAIRLEKKKRRHSTQ